MSGKAKTKKAGTKKKAQRATSNVFAMFDQQQIQEFKEAFGMIDQDRDGFIKETDLKDMFASLGTEKSKDYIEEMLGEAAGPLNFTMFLTIMGEKLNGTDPEDMIRNAFASFDPAGSGILNEDRLRPLLKGMGERFTEEECEEMFHLANADDNGNFNYVEFVKTIKHGSKDD